MYVCMYLLIGTVMGDISPFFEGNCREVKEVVDSHARISGSDSDKFVMGIPTHCQNDGSYLYLLTPVLSPPSTNSVYRWLSCDDKGSLELVNLLIFYLFIHLRL